jgi:hypothetical protein
MEERTDQPPKAESHQFSEEELALIAKSLRARELRIIASNVAKSLKPRDFVAIGKTLGKSPIFWICFAVGIGCVCYAAWKAVPHFVAEKAQTVWNQEITNQIKIQFQEPRISNIVVAVASSEATAILKRDVNPEIVKFETSLEEKMMQMQTNVNSMADNLFSNEHNEEFLNTDTNRVAVRTFGDGASQVFFTLESVPLKGTPRGIWQYRGNQVPMTPLSCEQNIAYAFFTKGSILEGKFIINYIENKRNTNCFRSVSIHDGEVFFDKYRMKFK